MPIEVKRCKRCNHEWIPRSFSEPTVCPDCNSPYWNRDRKERVKK